MASKKTIQAYAVPDDTERRELPPLTWQLLSRSTAGLLLVGSFTLWLRLLLTFVDLAQPGSVGQAVIWFTTLMIAIILAVGCAFVPPILWSAIIPSSVASNVLSWLYAKYGTAGYYFCFITALMFTIADLWLVSLFWQSQTIFQQTELAQKSFTSEPAQTITLIAFTFVTVFLFVGFTAWALARMTPAQLIAAISESQHAATILRAEKLKDMQFQVTYAYGVSLLKADLLQMGTHKFGEVSSQFAAIVADMQQHEERAFRNMAELMEAMGVGENVFGLVYDQNDPLQEQYRRMVKALKSAADFHREIADYGAEVAELTAPAPMSTSLPAPNEANVIEGVAAVQQRVRERSANVTTAAQSQREEIQQYVDASLQRSADVRSSPPVADSDGQDVTLNVLAATFRRGMFKASTMVQEFGISQRSAERLIEGWRESGSIVACGMKGTYALAITKEEA